MAAGKWKLYNTAKEKIGQGIIDLDSHTFKIALFTSSSNCDTLTHDEFADLTNEVSNGNGYTTGGQAITVTWVRSSGTVTFDSNDVSWLGSGVGFTCRYAVIYDDTVSGDPLLCVCVMDNVDVTVLLAQTLGISMNALGIFNLTGATSN